MGMGRFEIHAENVAEETHYLGCRHLERHYDLYAVLGLIRQRDDSPRLVTKRGLPNDVSPEVAARAEELGDDEEGAWRHVGAKAALEFPYWKDVVEVTYVHGPNNHVAWRERNEVCRKIPYETWRRGASRGWRELSPDAMHALIKARPELLADPHQGIVKDFTLACERMAAAERRGFDGVLGWLRELRPTKNTRLVMYFEI